MTWHGDPHRWAQEAAQRYLVEAVLLAGSRGFGYARPDSDWDVVVALEAGAYHDRDLADALERRLAFDPSLLFAGLDLFFVRPDGDLRRWAFGPDGPRPELLQAVAGDDHLLGCLVSGEPVGDFNRLWRDLPRAPAVWQRNEPAGDDPAGDEEKEEHEMTEHERADDIMPEDEAFGLDMDAADTGRWALDKGKVVQHTQQCPCGERTLTITASPLNVATGGKVAVVVLDCTSCGLHRRWYVEASTDDGPGIGYGLGPVCPALAELSATP